MGRKRRIAKRKANLLGELNVGENNTFYNTVIILLTDIMDA